MRKLLRRWYYALVPTYKRIDFKVCTWERADQIIKEEPRWRIAKEDEDLHYPIVAIELVERITE